MSTNINVSDIDMIVKLIDIVAGRGAFKGVELETVGQLRNRLALILESSKKDNPTENVEPSL
jgi:hypothetical protein